MKKYAAEFIGTFILVGIGGLSVVAAVEHDMSPLVPGAFGFGLGLMAAIWAVGHVSGGHFNPAVTLAMVLDRRTGVGDAVGYVVAQVAGAIVAAYAVVASTWGEASEAATFINNSPGMQDEVGAAFLLEVILTAIFVTVILISTKTDPKRAGLVISFTLVAAHLASIPFTGTSVNPARSLGPAIAAGAYESLWVFLVAPLVGGVLAWVIAQVVKPAASDA